MQCYIPSPPPTITARSQQKAGHFISIPNHMPVFLDFKSPAHGKLRTTLARVSKFPGLVNRIVKIYEGKQVIRATRCQLDATLSLTYAGFSLDQIGAGGRGDRKTQLIWRDDQKKPATRNPYMLFRPNEDKPFTTTKLLYRIVNAFLNEKLHKQSYDVSRYYDIADH